LRAGLINCSALARAGPAKRLDRERKGDKEREREREREGEREMYAWRLHVQLHTVKSMAADGTGRFSLAFSPFCLPVTLLASVASRSLSSISRNLYPSRMNDISRNVCHPFNQADSRAAHSN